MMMLIFLFILLSLNLQWVETMRNRDYNRLLVTPVPSHIGVTSGRFDRSRGLYLVASATAFMALCDKL